MKFIVKFIDREAKSILFPKFRKNDLVSAASALISTLYQ
jgi:hypothetical protein